MFRSALLFFGTSFTVTVFTIFATSNVDSIVGYSPQNIFNAKNFDPHKKLISLLNVPICTQGMQRTWWPEARTTIVTGPYSSFIIMKECWWDANSCLWLADHLCLVLEIPTGTPVRGPTTFLEDQELFVGVSWILCLCLRFKAWGPTTFWLEFQTPPVSHVFTNMN